MSTPQEGHSPSEEPGGTPPNDSGDTESSDNQEPEHRRQLRIWAAMSGKVLSTSADVLGLDPLWPWVALKSAGLTLILLAKFGDRGEG